jgi:hypothetical protein
LAVLEGGIEQLGHGTVQLLLTEGTRGYTKTEHTQHRALV